MRRKKRVLMDLDLLKKIYKFIDFDVTTTDISLKLVPKSDLYDNVSIFVVNDDEGWDELENKLRMIKAKHGMIEIIDKNGFVKLENPLTKDKVEKKLGVGDFIRASGDVVCKKCGFPYKNHPSANGAGYMNELCDGTLIKL